MKSAEARCVRSMHAHRTQHRIEPRSTFAAVTLMQIIVDCDRIEFSLHACRLHGVVTDTAESNVRTT
jgi:hypothetical protein